MGKRTIFVVVGPGTAFPGAKSTKRSDITQPHDKTILVVETTGQNCRWLEPRDLSFDNMSFATNDPDAKSISAKHRRIVALMADCTYQKINRLSSHELRSMFLIHPELAANK